MHEPSLQRAYAMFVRCHHIVGASTSEAMLATDVCRAAVDELGYRLAWIGVLEPDGDRIRPIGHAGIDEGYLDRIEIHVGDGDHGRGPTGTAVRERRVAVCRDIATDPAFEPWRADAIIRGYGASIAIPLVQGTQVLGALNLYATEARAFDEREIALLEEVALDVMLGLVALRAGQAHRPPVAAGTDRSELACGVAASVAHDLQNMLGVAMLSLSDLAKRLPEHAADRAYVDARDALRSASDLTRQVLVLSTRVLESAESADVDVCLQGMYSLLVRIAGPLATVSLDLRAGRGRVRLAAIDLERIVINLVLNASQAAGALVKIEISSRDDERSPGSVVLRVRDDGPGIPADLLPRVFDPAFTTKGAQGSGLGLASVAQLVRAAKGTIEVESDVGQGALFTLRVPRIDASAQRVLH